MTINNNAAKHSNTDKAQMTEKPLMCALRTLEQNNELMNVYAPQTL